MVHGGRRTLADIVRENLLEVLKDRGLSVRKLAKALEGKLSYNALQRFTRDNEPRTELSLSSLDLVIEALDIETGELFVESLEEVLRDALEANDAGATHVED